MAERDQTTNLDDGAAQRAVRGFQLTVLEGPAAGKSYTSTADRCSIGSHLSNDLVLDDATVSRFHCEVLTDSTSARVRDLDSRNGTQLDGVNIVEAFLRSGSLMKLGKSTLRFQFELEAKRLPLSDRHEFGTLVGGSAVMRATFALLERAAAADATVLVEGETGTGKERTAESIHQASARRERPFRVVDCSAIPANLLESELFGHEKGAFTSADSRRIGVFEEASTGTVFLDEIGELPSELQPKLLRVLEQKQVRRVGSNAYQPVDVRLIAATNRDLRAEVNSGRFRSDLYYRLAVLRIPLPPLRAHAEDIPLLVNRLLGQLGVEAAAAARIRTPAFLASLGQFAWPGNVRELKNYLERCLVFEVNAEPPAGAPAESDTAVSYAEGRKRALAAWERRYLEALLARHDGKVNEAAAGAEIDRAYLYRLLHRHHLK